MLFNFGLDFKPHLNCKIIIICSYSIADRYRCYALLRTTITALAVVARLALFYSVTQLFRSKITIISYLTLINFNFSYFNRNFGNKISEIRLISLFPISLSLSLLTCHSLPPLSRVFYSLFISLSNIFYLFLFIIQSPSSLSRRKRCSLSSLSLSQFNDGDYISLSLYIVLLYFQFDLWN